MIAKAMGQQFRPEEPPTAAAPTDPAPVGARMRLVVIDGPDIGRQLLLQPGEQKIGKREDCALALSDDLVSRLHAEICITATSVVVKDLDSKNGLYLAGARVTQAQLTDGALLRVGRTTLRFERLDDDPADDAPTQLGNLLGQSREMRRVFALLQQVAAADSCVLVDGETGTGKELCAEALHTSSARAKGPFVVCDLGGISRSLLESELFGYVRGAFTGAERDRMGLIEQAHGGTVFLDEIGELPLEMQTRLLRVLDQKQIKRIGGSAYRDVDVRVVAATRRDLDAEVKAGRFRSDLFYRLAVVRVRLPPLRERTEDIPLLVRSFIGERVLSLPPETLAWLAGHTWPGNVRELRNTIERALLLLKSDARELSPSVLDLNAPDSSEPATTNGFAEARDRMASAWERQYLQTLMARTEGNLSRASRESGIERTYLRRLLKRYDIPRGKQEGED